MLNRDINIYIFRKKVTKNAERESAVVFSRNLQRLLLVAPVKNKNVLSLCNKLNKNGCNLAVLDQNGMSYFTSFDEYE